MSEPAVPTLDVSDREPVELDPWKQILPSLRHHEAMRREAFVPLVHETALDVAGVTFIGIDLAPEEESG